MNVETLANKLGATIKVFVYGFILLIIVAWFFTKFQEGGEKVEKYKSQQQEQVQAGVDNKIDVELLGIEEGNYNDIAKAYDSVKLKVKIINNSDKDIEGVKGSLYVLDAFDSKTGSFEIESDEGLKAHESKEYNWTYSINLFDQGSQKVVGLKKWKSKFEAQKVLVK